MTELIGFIAGLLCALAFIPQVWRLFRLKSAGDISMPFTIALACGVSLWIVYGVALGSVPLIVANAAVLYLALSIMYAKVKYGK